MKLFSQIIALSCYLIVAQGEPSACPTDPDVVGFTTINDLNEWMSTIWYFINSGGFYPPPYFFSLCPNTVFDDSFIFPVLNDTWVLCGGSGSSEDNCIVQTNETQVILLPHDYTSEGAAAPPLEQVNFLGLTFRKSSDVSIGAYGSANSWVFFKDCHWEENFGRFSIHILPSNLPEVAEKEKGAISSSKTTDDEAMFVQLLDCTFTNNKQSHSTIVNNGGVLAATNVQFLNNENEWSNILMYDDKWSHVQDCLFKDTKNYFTTIAIKASLTMKNVEFDSNTNLETVVHVIDGSELVAQDCFFKDNDNEIGPSMVDDESTLFLNVGNSGYSNSGFGCEGFLLLDEGGACDADGECPSFCCEFGDITCDIQTSQPSLSPSFAPSLMPSITNSPTSLEKEEVVIAGIAGKGTTSSSQALSPRNVWIITMSIASSLTILSMPLM